VTKRDLLLEIGCEEIPARFIDDLRHQLADRLQKWLKEQRIDAKKAVTYATPRRIAVLIGDVAERQEDLDEEVRGPAKKIALTPDGSWSKAAEGFARKQGVPVDALVFDEFKGETYVFARKRVEGQPTATLLAEGLPSVLSSLHFPKTMRWGAERTRFIRPVRWLVCLFGEETVSFSWAGVTAGNRTRGHRFLGKEVTLSHPGQYVEALREQWVIADVNERRERILDQLRRMEAERGWRIPVAEDLLDEVTHLVEYPTVLAGSFDADFLVLPRAVLITTMREHQRYFPVESADGRLLPHFVTVRNGDETSLDVVAKGNEKVLRARLADARFFYDEDLKLPIDQAVEKLDQVVFHEELGTVGDKVRRIVHLADRLADALQWEEDRRRVLKRAAQICKFDLSTQMVYEFPELEGIMGEEYARKAGEDEEVARAIKEHHQPRHAGDETPQSAIGAVIGLADKMDTIAACFGIGIQPSGSQDPYGLRRRASGIVQILLDHGWSQLTLDQLWTIALERLQSDGLLKKSVEETAVELRSFFAQRLKTVLQEEGIRYDVIDAVLGADISRPKLVLAKARVLMDRASAYETYKLAVEGFTRTANLGVKGTPNVPLAEADMTEPAERKLYEAYQEAEKAFMASLSEQDADGMYEALASMVPVIHRFFDEVLVMVEDETVRTRRLGLLRRITDLVHQFARFDQLVLT
jgi:glycyl-tRNA synthetase beta chain